MDGGQGAPDGNTPEKPEKDSGETSEKPDEDSADDSTSAKSDDISTDNSDSKEAPEKPDGEATDESGAGQSEEITLDDIKEGDIVSITLDDDGNAFSPWKWAGAREALVVRIPVWTVTQRLMNTVQTKQFPTHPWSPQKRMRMQHWFPTAQKLHLTMMQSPEHRQTVRAVTIPAFMV